MSLQMDGFDRLQSLIDELGKVPQAVATKAAKQGANLLLSEVKQKAPYHTGLLEEALISVGEKAKSKGKKAYEITFDRQLSGDGKNGLVKISDITGNRAYYPNSQEYGWTIHGHKGLYGLHYMRNTAQNESDTVEQKIISVAMTEIQKVLDKAR